MVLVGKINRELVAAVNAVEPLAVGVAGEDARLLEASPIDPALGFVGTVSKVRAGSLHALLDDGLIPIVSTVGADAEGQPYNVNADDAARAIAVAMGAEKIIYLTGAPGLLDDPEEPASLVHRLTTSEARARINDAGVTGGMIPKLLACAEAVEGGVGSAHMIEAARSIDPDRNVHRPGIERWCAGRSGMSAKGTPRMIGDWLREQSSQPGGAGCTLAWPHPATRRRLAATSRTGRVKLRRGGAIGYSLPQPEPHASAAMLDRCWRIGDGDRGARTGMIKTPPGPPIWCQCNRCSKREWRCRDIAGDDTIFVDRPGARQNHSRAISHTARRGLRKLKRQPGVDHVEEIRMRCFPQCC